jgi:hypothetical protein
MHLITTSSRQIIQSKQIRTLTSVHAPLFPKARIPSEHGTADISSFFYTWTWREQQKYRLRSFKSKFVLSQKDVKKERCSPPKKKGAATAQFYLTGFQPTTYKCDCHEDGPNGYELKSRSSPLNRREKGRTLTGSCLGLDPVLT